jgi:hypothetical protein
MKEKKKLQIAKACHAVHNVLCANNGLQVIDWEDKPTEHHAVVINSIEKILSGEVESAEQAHNNFVHMKEEFGWEYGPEYSERFKTNPRLCDWHELDPVERQKEEYFFAVASSFKKKEAVTA